VSVVIPTRNEAQNIEPLVGRLQEQLPFAAEIIFVDDSSDDTPAAVERAARQAAIDVRLIHRSPGEREGGLGGAVLAGLRAARGTWVCVMDADLQHPPERVPDLLARAMQGNVDVVVASRYTAGGSPGSFGAAREAVSRLSNLGSRVCFPRRLRGVTDPMSGFFILRKDALDIDRLRPRGFKILLEILARSRGLRVGEVPFQFGERFAGDSKASVREGLLFLAQLARLRLGQTPASFTRFAICGASGIVVNMLLFAAFYEVFGFHYLVAALLATQGSTLWLFVLTDRWVFARRPNGHAAWTRAGMYFALNNASLIVRAALLVVLVSFLAVNPLLANFLSLVALTLGRFLVADSVIWKHSASAPATGPVSYDIHGLVAVESDVELPELAGFCVERLDRKPNVRIRVGQLGRAQSRLLAELAFAGRHVRYDEGLGRLGFRVDIIVGRQRTEVVASPLLRSSPHVLYTNVVEPILRWTFVRKGYALVHAACVAFGDRAVLVTARTDTGKTTTILKALDTYHCSFVSDDLTLLSPDGHVLTYPKPLTVSRHTVNAVKTPLLSRRERLTLPVQSRIHSRSGRRFAFLLTRARFPVATINALVQLLVPPPKYDVGRLVPGVERAHTAPVVGLAVIERAADEVQHLGESEALTMLVDNCEDAFGFPPYPTIARFLHGESSADLHSTERQIIRSALTEVPATLIRSSSMEWWTHLPAIAGVDHGERQESRQQEVVAPAAGFLVAPE
jgi:glycosyltransferase involved in cell wall biosynthesis